MQPALRVTDPKSLNVITDVIHDRWFEVDDVAIEEGRKCLRIPFRPDWVLEISEVESYQLEETEGVGRYDFNKFAYSESDRTLMISTGVPLVFRVTVASLDVSLSELSPA